MDLSKSIRKIDKKNNRHGHWLRTRMWFSWILSSMYPDRETIPRDIGNSIMITNNRVITKNSISAYVFIEEYSLNVPLGFISVVIDEVKSKVPGTWIDYIARGNTYSPDLYSDGIKARTRHWQKNIDTGTGSKKKQEQDARLLYSHDVLQRGETAFRGYSYFIIRSEDSRVTTAVHLLEKYLKDLDITQRIISSSLESHVKNASILSRVQDNIIRDGGNTILSATALAEMLPTTQGINDYNGICLGMDIKNGQPYFVDTEGNERGKNVMVVSVAGYGKTVIVKAIGHDAFLMDYDILMMDIKGNEFLAPAIICGASIISLKSTATYYMNTFRLRKEDAKSDPLVYYSSMLNLSKKQLIITSDPLPEQLSRTESFFEEMLKSMYMSLGIEPTNVNTYFRTDHLNPYETYKYFKSYLSSDIRKVYSDVIENIISKMKEYYSEENGSHSYLFRDELILEELLDRRGIVFDFAMLDTASVPDRIVLTLKAFYMEIIRDAYSAHKARKGRKIFAILEEIEIIKDTIMDMYVKDVTLRRAQGQFTVMLGNSMEALINNPKANVILDNLNFLLIGAVNNSTRDYLERTYDLQEQREDMDAIAKYSPEYENVFVLINRIQTRGGNTLVKAFIPDDVLKGPLYKVSYEE